MGPADAHTHVLKGSRAPFGWGAHEVGAILLALTALRVAGLLLSPLDLHGDEAQYWAWSRTLDWGYFSKPPLVAWAIAATTGLFGNDEWAVRLAAPLAHGAAAWVLFLLARRIYGPAAGVWAALGWALMPGVWLSSAVIATDGLLLPLWSLALLCAWRFSETRDGRWAAALGAALGAGLMAKYAMLYFLAGLALWCWWSPPARRAFLSRAGLAAFAIAAAIIAPNLAWNAAHSFATLSHTAANANLGGDLFHPEDLGEFFLDQAGVAGPLQFGALLFLLVTAARGFKTLPAADRFCLAFALPALAFIAVQAFVSRAHGNWAASAYPAAVVWIAGRFAAGPGVRLLKANAALHALVGAAFFAAAIAPPVADAMGLARALKRSRAWDETAALIAARVEAGAAGEAYTAILVDNRLVFYSLQHAWRDAGPPAPLRMWVLNAAPGNQAEAAAPMRAADGARTLIVNAAPDYAGLIAGDFAASTDLKDLAVPLGRGQTRTLALSEGRVFRPVPRDEAFQARLDAARR